MHFVLVHGRTLAIRAKIRLISRRKMEVSFVCERRGVDERGRQRDAANKRRNNEEKKKERKESQRRGEK